MQNKRLTVKEIIVKKGKEPIVCLTAYTAPVAKIVDQYVDVILVGDSLGMVVYGMDSTLSVTMEMMIGHGKAVVKASEKSCVVVDMPFGSYQKSPAQAFANAARIVAETSCQAIKLEGGEEMAETIKFLVDRGIPVMAHIGLMPQKFNIYGGYAPHGKDKQARKKILSDALSIQEAGAFSVVIEAVMEDLAVEVTKKLKIPVIGIGASVECDGQVLVSDDIFGLFSGFKPKFVRRYAEIGAQIKSAVKQYSEDVRGRKFPNKDNYFN